jgi:hypothetical protein
MSFENRATLPSGARLLSERSVRKGSVLYQKWQFKIDVPKIKKLTEKSELTGLKSIGAFARKVAQRSMRKRFKPSKPGQPPSVHSGGLKKGIVFAVDKAHASVLIGPLKISNINGKRFASKDVAPATLEYGGNSGEYLNKRRRVRKVGDGGEIRMVSGAGIKFTEFKGKREYYKPSNFRTVMLKFSRNWRTNEVERNVLYNSNIIDIKAVKDLHGRKKFVAYTKIKTASQAARANRLNEELYGPMRLKGGHVAARPYMKPADEVTRKQMIPGAFAGTFK